jgi:CBS domain-containing protein
MTVKEVNAATGIRVLLADDDAALRQLVVRLLAKAGIEEVVEAEDGTEALTTMFSGETDFDAALIDWYLPGKDGLTVVKAMRAAGCQMPIVMITGEAREARVKEAVQAGVSKYIVKPLEPDKFVAEMQALRRELEMRKLGSSYRARHVMSRDVVTLRPETTVSEAIRELLTRQVSGAPVVDEEERLLGIITEYQLVRVVQTPELRDHRVEESMTREVCAVNEDTLLSQVASLILQHRFRVLPVVRNGKLVGIVARRDLLQYALDNEAILENLVFAVRSFALERPGLASYFPIDMSWARFLPERAGTAAARQPVRSA